MNKSFGLIRSWRSIVMYVFVFGAGYVLAGGYIANNSKATAESSVKPAVALKTGESVETAELVETAKAVETTAKTQESEERYLAPDLLLERLEGGQVKLSDYRGKWVFVNLWATWCPPCVYEMPAMEKFYQKFKDQNFTILAISVDFRDAKQDVIDFVIDKNLTFEIFLDPENKSIKEFKTMALPSTYIIDPDGYVVSQAQGAREWMDPVIIEYFADLMSLDVKEVL